MSLSHHQFGGLSEDLRLHGDKYVLHHAEKTLMHAYPVVRDPEGQVVHPASSGKRPVGSMSWFSGVPTEADLASKSNVVPGKIYKVSVRPAHQRRGIATAMLQFARDRNPEAQIRHSGALSPDGRAWAEKAG